MAADKESFDADNHNIQEGAEEEETLASLSKRAHEKLKEDTEIGGKEEATLSDLAQEEGEDTEVHTKKITALPKQVRKVAAATQSSLPVRPAALKHSAPIQVMSKADENLVGHNQAQDIGVEDQAAEESNNADDSEEVRTTNANNDGEASAKNEDTADPKPPRTGAKVNHNAKNNNAPNNNAPSNNAGSNNVEPKKPDLTKVQNNAEEFNNSPMGDPDYNIAESEADKGLHLSVHHNAKNDIEAKRKEKNEPNQEVPQPSNLAQKHRFVDEMTAKKAHGKENTALAADSPLRQEKDEKEKKKEAADKESFDADNHNIEEGAEEEETLAPFSQQAYKKVEDNEDTETTSNDEATLSEWAHEDGEDTDDAQDPESDRREEMPELQQKLRIDGTVAKKQSSPCRKKGECPDNNNNKNDDDNENE